LNPNKQSDQLIIFISQIWNWR